MVALDACVNKIYYEKRLPLSRKPFFIRLSDIFDLYAVFKALIVSFDALVDNSACFVFVANLVDHRLFSLKGLVNGEEVGHFVVNVLGQGKYAAVSVVNGIGEGDRNDLFIRLSAVKHLNNADGIALYEGHGDDGLGANYQNVKWVSVLGKGAGNEAVACGIVGGCVKDSVKL